MNALLLAACLATTPAHACHTCGEENWRSVLPPRAQQAVRNVDTLDRWWRQDPEADPKPEPEPTTQPPDQLTETEIQKQRHEADLKADAELGAKYAAEVEKQYKLSTNEAMVARVQALGAEFSQIANANQVRVSWGDARLNTFQYQFRVAEGKEVNAFSLPGGFIYFYEGLLDYVESDAELAGIVAHEIAHASFRHIATLRKEQSRLEAFTLPLILISILTGGTGVAAAGSLFSQAMGSGWSVKAEQSADLGAFQYMVLSQHNPVGLMTFMERLAFDERVRRTDWGIYQTHPPSRERVRAVRALLKEAKIPVERSKVTGTFATQITEKEKGVAVRYAGVEIYTFFGPSAKERAAVSAMALNAFFDRMPKLQHVKAYSDDAVEGFDETLLQVSGDDAEATGQSIKDLRKAALEAVKTAIFELNYRIADF